MIGVAGNAASLDERLSIKVISGIFKGCLAQNVRVVAHASWPWNTYPREALLIRRRTSPADTSTSKAVEKMGKHMFDAR